MPESMDLFLDENAGNNEDVLGRECLHQWRCFMDENLHQWSCSWTRMSASMEMFLDENACINGDVLNENACINGDVLDENLHQWSCSWTRISTSMGMFLDEISKQDATFLFIFFNIKSSNRSYLLFHYDVICIYQHVSLN